MANGVVALFENSFGAKALWIYTQIKSSGSLGGTVVMKGTTLGLGILGILNVVSRVEASADFQTMLHLKQDVDCILMSQISLHLKVRHLGDTLVAAKKVR